METPPPLDLKRRESELEAELRRALVEACQETGISLPPSWATAALLRKFQPDSVSAEKLADWFIATRRVRSKLRSRTKSQFLRDLDQCSLEEAPAVKDSDELESLGARERLQKAGPVDINSSSFSWEHLVSLHDTEHATRSGGQDKDTAPSMEVTVNSGGVVYFAVFENGTAACLKFTPSRLTTQSERLGYELARHLGVSTPQARVIRSSSDEWQKIIQATEQVKLTATSNDRECEKTCAEMLEALQLSRCLLLMGYVNGCSFLESEIAFSTQTAAEQTAAALGRVLLLDLVLRNEDRLSCQQLGWRGNPGNLLCTEREPIKDPLKTAEVEPRVPLPLPRRKSRPEPSNSIEVTTSGHYLVAIDSGVPRRPPAHKREFDKENYPKLVELVLNDPDVASEVLGEISGGNLGVRSQSSSISSSSLDQVKVMNAFRSSFRAGLKDMHSLRTFLLKLQRRLDHYMKQFVADISENLPPDWSPDKASPGSTTSSPTLGHSNDRVSPQGKLERRFTLQLKDFNKLAKVDGGIHGRVEHWDSVLQSEGCKLTQAYGFVTGFLEDRASHSVVDSYELKIRLEHVLERMDLIVQGGETERPSRVLDSLYIGGALAAKSFHTLQRIGITHLLCLCPIETGAPEPGFLQAFEYKAIQVLDIVEEDIASHFQDACSYIEAAENQGGKALVHCFEGKSRSATIVLAYLMQIKGYTLLRAWSLLKAAHPRAQPNDAFMDSLRGLDKQLHRMNSMEWQRRRPQAQVCPVCGKGAGFSSESLQRHLHKAHPS